MVKNQVIVNHLTNDYEYRFTVKSGNVKGMSLESTPSNPGMYMLIGMVQCVYLLISLCTMRTVMVEAPLPPGWYVQSSQPARHRMPS